MTWGKGNPRTSTAAWRKTRRFVLARDGHRCTWLEGGRRCTNPATEVDHIREWADGGIDDPSNLRSLCEPHHYRKTAQHANLTRWARRQRPEQPHPGVKR